MLAGALFHNLLDHLLADVIIQTGAHQGLLEQRAGIGKLQIPAVVVDVTDISQGKDRFAAIALAARHGGNCTGRGDCCLGGVADAMLFNPADDLFPIDRRAAPIAAVRLQSLGRLPFHVLRVVNAAFDCREWAALFRQVDAGQHGMVAHELHHLGGELLPFFRTVADAGMVHQIAQPHDPQPNAPGAMRRHGKLRHCRYISIGLDHIVQKSCRQGYAAAQLLPIHRAIRAAVLRQVDRTQTAVFVWAEELLSTIMGYKAVRQQAVGLRLAQVIYICQTGRLYIEHPVEIQFAIAAAFFTLYEGQQTLLSGIIHKTDQFGEKIAIGFANHQFILSLISIYSLSPFAIRHTFISGHAPGINTRQDAKICQQHLHILQQGRRTARQAHRAILLGFIDLHRTIGAEQTLQKAHHCLARRHPQRFRHTLLFSVHSQYAQ